MYVYAHTYTHTHTLSQGEVTLRKSAHATRQSTEDTDAGPRAQTKKLIGVSAL